MQTDFSEHIMWGDIAVLFKWGEWNSIFGVYALSSLLGMPVFVEYPRGENSEMRRFVVPHNVSAAHATALHAKFSVHEYMAPRILFSGEAGGHELRLSHFVTIFRKHTGEHNRTAGQCHAAAVN
jgi:hypothetical protein